MKLPKDFGATYAAIKAKNNTTWFSHAYDFALEVESQREDASDVTGEMLKAALLKRIASMPAAEFLEACGKFDTAEID
jgi:hypothetical protein